MDNNSSRKKNAKTTHSIGKIMKYKLAFVKECKKEYLWYNEELKKLFARHGMSDLFESKIEPIDLYRWYPEEIFAVLER